jgi:hypothetical protein
VQGTAGKGLAFVQEGRAEVATALEALVNASAAPTVDR